MTKFKMVYWMGVLLVILGGYLLFTDTVYIGDEDSLDSTFVSFLIMLSGGIVSTSMFKQMFPDSSERQNSD